MSVIDLIKYFDLNKNEDLKRWEFKPTSKIKSTSYTISFSEANSEEDAYISLYLAIKKSPEFEIIK